MKKVKNKLQVRHYAQIPCKPFCVDVADENEAYKILNIIADQHLFLLKENIIPDYCNAIEVVMWDEDSDGEGNADWVSYWNEEEMMDWNELVENYFEQK